MQQGQGRFKKLKPFSEEIMYDYLENELNMSEIAVKYKVHYSNLRRFIKHEIKERGLEENFNVQYLNCEDFRFLSLGDTFSFDEHLTVWRVIKLVVKEGEDVFELVPSPSKSKRHWICGVNVPEDDYIPSKHKDSSF